MATPTKTEWPTVGVLVLTYLVWGIGTNLWQVSGVLAIAITTIAIAQSSSLSHEVLHGHPFPNQRLNEALVFPALTLVAPYIRFRDTHLQHHFDPALTDPYDDPEANFHDPQVWARKSALEKTLLSANNTLLGRMLLGPGIGTWSFIKGDIALHRAGDPTILRAWVLNGLGVLMVLFWLWGFATMPVWAYVIAAYLGYSLIKIRTFLEHRAHEVFRARTVVVESRGPLSYLFLNNNFHVVHHMHPGVAWYKLPALYFAKKDHYLRRNDGYVFANYTQIFREFLFKAKDPVPHPIWPVRKADQPDMDA
jgi:fatty acid desaturase